MVANDTERQVTQERIAYFRRVLAALRRAARPDEYGVVSGGYSREITRMRREVRSYDRQRPLGNDRRQPADLAGN